MRKINRKPGTKFGRLTLIKEAGHDRWGARQFEFKCACGKTVVVRWGITESCGCLQKESLDPTNKKKRFGFGQAAFLALYRRYKHRAKQCKVPFTLNEDQVAILTSARCHYCGSPPAYYQKCRGNFGEWRYNGMDRKSPTDGYTPTNTVPCCIICNRAKMRMSYEKFIKWIHTIKTYETPCIQ